MPGFGGARITSQSNVGGNQTRARGDFAEVHEAFAVLVVIVNQSVWFSGSNNWIGAPGMIVEMACL